MSEIWFISDTHFGHANILKFTRSDGSPVRPGFRDVDHMDEVLIENWNKIVGPNDKIYHLGDVAFGNKTAVLDTYMPRLNGKKRLILGNHDNADVEVYRKHFQKIASWRHFTDDGCALICTHFPLHRSSFLGRYDGSCVNVHGHIHARVIDDPEYKNVCVEQTSYQPVHYETLLKLARDLRATCSK